MKVVALVLVLLCLPFAGFRINLTHSMPIGIYRITHEAIHRGGLVAFCLDDKQYTELARDRGYLAEGSCPSGLQPLLKQVAGLPGDVIGFSNGLITVNGHILAGTAPLKTDSRGRPAPVSCLAVGVIAPGKALVLSQWSPDSFDGRYFGLVPLDSLVPVKKVLTSNHPNI